MLATKNNKMMQRVMMMAVWAIGLSFVGASSAVAQDCKDIADTAKKDCWVKKAKSGQKDLKWAFLFEADLSGVDLRGVDLINFPRGRAARY